MVADEIWVILCDNFYIQIPTCAIWHFVPSPLHTDLVVAINTLWNLDFKFFLCLLVAFTRAFRAFFGNHLPASLAFRTSLRKSHKALRKSLASAPFTSATSCDFTIFSTRSITGFTRAFIVNLNLFFATKDCFCKA